MEVKEGFRSILLVFQRAFSEFLGIPSLIIIGFLSLSLLTNFLDRASIIDSGWLGIVQDFLKNNIFSDSSATTGLLTSISTGLITMTSITFSLLLIAVQQAASTISSEIYDQFLRRPINQVFFGFFIGLALYTLIVLSTTSEPFNPVIGATVAFLFMIIALFLLIVLIYSSINQMRPAVIVDAVHDLTLSAREKQLEFLSNTRRRSSDDSKEKYPVHIKHHGFFVGINIDAVNQAVEDSGEECEVVLFFSIGEFIAYDSIFAEVKADTQEAAKPVIRAVQEYVDLAATRNIQTDPAFGVNQLENIAWTSISTSKSNPGTAQQAIYSIQDIMVHICTKEEVENENPTHVVYIDDVPGVIFGTLETLAVATSQSMQHHTLALILRSLALVWSRLPDELKQHGEKTILRLISLLGDHVLTKELDSSISELIFVLNKDKKVGIAQLLQEARNSLAESLGNLNSRYTRALQFGKLRDFE